MPHKLRTQWFLDSGAVNAGGSISFYLAGGTTASNLAYPSYDDAVAGSNTLGTSVTLDSAGRPGTAEQVWFTDIAMKYIVKDSDGTQVGPTIDDLYGSGSGQMIAIASDDTAAINILADNSATALVFKEASNNYMIFDTLNNYENVEFVKQVFFGDDVQLLFGNTVADPDAYIEWDTSGTDVFRLRVDNTGNMDLQTSSGDIVLKPADTTVLTVMSTEVRSDKAVFIKEAAAAVADLSGYGQIWVKSTDSKLYFTGDDGTDHEIAFA